MITYPKVSRTPALLNDVTQVKTEKLTPVHLGVSAATAERSQAAAAAAPGVPEADGGEAGNAPEAAAVPALRHRPRQRLPGRGPWPFGELRPQHPQHHAARLQPLKPVLLRARKHSH